MIISARRLSFNTQPPEGGWAAPSGGVPSVCSFNTQPPEGGWVDGQRRGGARLGFNTQPPEGGWVGNLHFDHAALVSTHSRPKAAGEHL